MVLGPQSYQKFLEASKTEWNKYAHKWNSTHFIISISEPDQVNCLADEDDKKRGWIKREDVMQYINIAEKDEQVQNERPVLKEIIQTCGKDDQERAIEPGWRFMEYEWWTIDASEVVVKRLYNIL